MWKLKPCDRPNDAIGITESIDQKVMVQSCTSSRGKKVRRELVRRKGKCDAAKSCWAEAALSVIFVDNRRVSRAADEV